MSMEVYLIIEPLAPSFNKAASNYVLGCALCTPMGDGFLRIDAIDSARVTSVARVPDHPDSCQEATMLLLEPEISGQSEIATRAQDNIARPQPAGDVVSAQADEFLEEVYRLDHSGETQSATFKVFDYMESLLDKRSFDVCNKLLERVDVNRLSPSLMRSFLTITHPAKDQLPERKRLFTLIEDELTRTRGREIATRLLCKLS